MNHSDLRPDLRPFVLPPEDREQISVCMIVRDEEQDLPRCLHAARPFAGEIVVVDTGSRDATVAVARSFGAQVIHFPWCEDFSAARNVSLDAATRPWALVLDADDELKVPDPAEIARAVRSERVAGFQVLYLNILDAGQTSRCDVFRLFRRDLPGMRYRGQVHEQVAAVADGPVVTGRLDQAHIRHDGYQAERMLQHDKHARNLRLCQALVSSRPQDPYSWYCLAIQQTAADPAEAARGYRRALELWAAQGPSRKREAFIAQSYVGLTRVLLFQGDEQAAERCLEEGVRHFPESAELRYLRAERLLQRGDAAGALKDLLACTTPASSPAGTVLLTNDSVTSYEGRTLLAVAYLRLERLAEAEAQLVQAVSQAVPGYATAHRLLGMVLMCRGAWAEAIPYLREALLRDPSDQTSLRVSLGDALFRLGRRDEALRELSPVAQDERARTLIARMAAAP